MPSDPPLPPEPSPPPSPDPANPDARPRPRARAFTDIIEPFADPGLKPAGPPRPQRAPLEVHTGTPGNGAQETQGASSTTRGPSPETLALAPTVVPNLGGATLFAATTRLIPSQDEHTPVNLRGRPTHVLAPSEMAKAMPAEWICLRGEEPFQSYTIMLWPKPAVTLGKLRKPPTDIFLRTYPESEKTQQLSRSHLKVAINGAGCTVTDPGSLNGTRLDGLPLTSPVTLGPNRPYLVVLGDVMILGMRALGHPGAIPGHPNREVSLGVDGDSPVDAVLIGRAENRPNLIYGMVLRSLTIGGRGAGLELPGTRDFTGREFGVLAGRWVHRELTGGDWLGLTAGAVVDCAGAKLRVEPGTYEQFD
jgi:hypothetical protein